MADNPGCADSDRKELDAMEKVWETVPMTSLTNGERQTLCTHVASPEVFRRDERGTAGGQTEVQACVRRPISIDRTIRKLDQ